MDTKNVKDWRRKKRWEKVADLVFNAFMFVVAVSCMLLLVSVAIGAFKHFVLS